MSLLEVEKVTVTAGESTLLSGASVSVNAGEVVAIVGPNGAGKTTLLRAISGDVAFAGQVRLKGQPLGDYTQRDLAQQMAVLTQHNTLGFAFSGFEVVSLGRTPHSTGAAIDVEICQAAMQRLDVFHLAGRAYPTLSGGERQRLHLARVLAQIWRAHDAGDRLLLLDEPVTSLDIAHQHQLMQVVRGFAESGVAVLMTVHDMTLAGAYSDRLLALKQGECVAQGGPDDVLTESVINRVFDTRVVVLPHPDTGRPVVVSK